MGPLFGLVFVALVAHAIIRHRLMDVRLVIHRGLTITAAVLVSLVPVATAAVLFWPRLAEQLDAGELLVLAGAMVLATLLAPPTRDVAGRLLDRYVYRTHANFQKTVREASRMLTRELHLETLLRFVTGTVSTSIRVDGVAVYIRGDRGLALASWERHPRSTFGHPALAPPVVTARLDTTRDVLLTDEVARELATDEQRALFEALSGPNWALLLPLISEGTVIGAIVVGPKLSGDAFFPQDLDLLMTLANQAGIATRNAQLYAEVVLANQYISNIVATIESGVVAVTRGGTVTLFNRAAEQLTGLSAEEVCRRDAGALPRCLAEPIQAVLDDGEPRTVPEVDLPGGAGTRPVICTTSPLRDPAGAILGAVTVVSDLTPVKALEAERRRAERLAYFQVLAAGLAHEIKNPLVSIKAFAQLMPRRRNEAAFVAEFERVMTRQIERMEHLLERLRTLSRPGSRPRQTLDLRALLGDALESMRPAFDDKGVALDAALGDGVHPVHGDPGELEQLLQNLLMNAHEATPPGGTVSVALTRAAERLTITVADTGPGIPASLLDHVFDPFVTTKPRGGGLGLAISAGIAAGHRARLRAANRQAGGAIFTLDVPVAVPATIPAST